MSKKRPCEGFALITDLDGTLLLPDKTVSPADAAAIADFRAKGGIFSIATGRGIQATAEFLDLLQPDFPAVMYNGALVYDQRAQAPAYAAHLPAETGALLAELMREFPAVGAELLDLSGVYVIQDGEYERRHLAITHLPMVQRPLDEMNPAACMKALFAGSPEDIDRMLRYVQAERFSVVNFTRSHTWFLEILPHHTNKGTALSRIRQMLPPGTVIGATGDFDNDIAMLEEADFCGCPADAQESVRNAVTGCRGFVGAKTCADGFFAEWLAAFLNHVSPAD
ncbi:MAG: Cof-type HAD-IIB family hydrolase [Oscillospiraceae bacterium]|nr:Cof-type HAD-IIB family hydrolase [Oscillospiraceae bacterium]